MTSLCLPGRISDLWEHFLTSILDEKRQCLVEMPENSSPDKALCMRDYFPAEAINDQLIELGQNEILIYYWDAQREDISYVGKSDILQSDHFVSN